MTPASFFLFIVDIRTSNRTYACVEMITKVGKQTNREK